MQDEVEFREEIGTAISPLITLLNDDYWGVRSTTVSALGKLAEHGEFVVVHYSDVADAGMESSFSRKSGQPFHHSLRC
jgi:HEAT repeat protein